ncbi:MAG: polyprenyl synthetase family protein [Proteobacteria bacterium]|nr:polyprenyl synthetase family protein [Pseudomonadota bacterium]
MTLHTGAAEEVPLDGVARIEADLAEFLSSAEASAGPPLLAKAIRYAVFSGGARVRPRLCLAVAQACGCEQPAVVGAAAGAIELLHCASLVHDDLPCFDDADMRRGRASVHKAFGEPLAILAGDALIVLAFQMLARVADAAGARLPALLSIIASAVGPAKGIVGGQAWECEPRVVLSDYHQAKTGALFSAAAMAGAVAAARDPLPWRAVGARLGEAFQVADDIRDAAGEAGEIGKPAGRDAQLGRPSAVTQMGLTQAVARLEELVTGAIEVIPPGPKAGILRMLIEAEVVRLLPKRIARRAA